MATKNLRGLFQNNRRREAHSVTISIPALIEPADLREGTPDEFIVAGDTLELLEIPGNVIITDMCIVVTDPMDAGVTLKADIDVTPIIAAGDCATVGLTKSATTDPILVTQPTLITGVITGTPTVGSVDIVISYVDYKRATMSFIGED